MISTELDMVTPVDAQLCMSFSKTVDFLYLRGTKKELLKGQIAQIQASKQERLWAVDNSSLVVESVNGKRPEMRDETNDGLCTVDYSSM